MSYKLNKTDGDLLVDLIDGLIDTDTTDLTLIGKNYSGYGEFFNENFIKLLENFSNTQAPPNPLTGQLWYDTSEARLKIYNGSSFIVSGSAFVQATQPQMIAGDFWIDNAKNQVYAYDGTDLFLVGPIFTAAQGRSGFETVDIRDTQGRTRRVLKLWIGGDLVAVYSGLTFIPAAGQDITELPGEIRKGINVVDSANFRYYGIATSATNLTTAGGGTKSASQFLPADENGITTGTLTIQNSNGLTIGLTQNNIQKVVGSTFVVENQLLDHDYKIRVRSTAAGSLLTDAITVRASSRRVGIFQENPQYNLDVTGDCRITGNLLVEGTSASVDVTTLRIEDKNIELGISSDSTLQTRAIQDGAGIIVRATGNDINFVYQDANAAWLSSENLNLASGNVYQINGDPLLTATALGSSITSAPGLISIGTLNELDVDNINLNGVTITTTGSGLNLTSAGTITINNQKITGVAEPTTAADVATKNYVDTQIDSEPVVMELDITGMVSVDAEIISILNFLYPAVQKINGTQARIATVSYTGSVSGAVVTVTQQPDTSGAVVISKIAVDSAGTQNESVVQDVAQGLGTLSGVVGLSVVRGQRTYYVNAGSWSTVAP